MRRLLALTLVVSALCPQLFAGKHDWERVKKMKHGTSVYVTLRRGQPVNGHIVGADDRSLSVATDYPWDNGVPEEIARENVRRIVHFRHRVLPNPREMVIGGTLAGAAVGATVGALEDTKPGNHGQWLPDGLAGVTAGFLGGCVTEAGFGIVAIFRPDKVVYERTP